jgi:hypothetical protein
MDKQIAGGIRLSGQFDRSFPQETSLIATQSRHRGPVEWPRPAVEPEGPGGGLDAWRRRQPGDRVRSFGWGAEERAHHAGETRQSLAQARRRGPAGMHGVEADPRAAETPRPLADQRDLGSLRAGICTRAVVDAMAVLEVIEVESLGVLPPGRDRDDTRAAGPIEKREEATDQRERTDHQCRERRLDAIGAQRAFREDRAGVVDHDIEPWLGGEDIAARRADRHERGHVRDDDRESILAVSLDELVANIGESLPAPADEDDPRAESREITGDLAPQSGCRAGDEHRPAGEAIRGWRIPAEYAPPNCGADAAEAADDRQLQQGINQITWVHERMMTHLSWRDA